MRILVSKILFIFLFISFSTELTVIAFAKNDPVYSMMGGDESEDKKEEEKKEKEEKKDYISFQCSIVIFTSISDNIFLRNIFFKNSAFNSLPEIPPKLS
ncbi:MAG: hypothetical protein SGI96_03040 [Bacteroidota bacterium]|nr:hypothetical protein [Bacteroidota bacterium]